MHHIEKIEQNGQKKYLTGRDMTAHPLSTIAELNKMSAIYPYGKINL